jgi:hypothetical protein
MSNKKYDLSDVQQLLNEGYTVQDIMKMKGCKHHFTIYSYIKQNNIVYESRYSKDLTGYEWNNMKVLNLDVSTKKKERYWNIECHCGNIFRLNTYEIFKSNQKSCGCIFKSKDYKLSHPNRKGYKDISGIIWSKIKRDAKARGIQFDLNIEDLWELLESQNRKCKLSGLELSFRKKAKDYTGTASLDRIDSKKGYIIDNIQWVHKTINTMKMDLEQETFLMYCNLIVQNNKKDSTNEN